VTKLENCGSGITPQSPVNVRYGRHGITQTHALKCTTYVVVVVIVIVVIVIVIIIIKILMVYWSITVSNSRESNWAFHHLA
jgi:hypothetical protein